MLFGVAVGLLNGVHGDQDALAQLHRHAGDVLRAAGRERRAHAEPDRHDRDPEHRHGRRLRLGRADLRRTTSPTYAFKTKVLWWIALTIVGAWLLAKTRFGNWIYSAGGDPTAARNVGVPVARTKILLFVMTSCTACLMGIIEARGAALDERRHGNRPRVLLHHLRRRRRVPADGRLRLGDRHVLRRVHPRHGAGRDPVRAAGTATGRTRSSARSSSPPSCSTRSSATAAEKAR